MVEVPEESTEVRRHARGPCGHRLLRAHLCDDVRALADELCIRLHFIPRGLTDILQTLDRALFGALKAEYRGPYWYEMSQRGDKSLTKADFAASLLLAWVLVSEDAIPRG
jgi:hypothetical protein